mgnify:CR=1 FL=1
MHMCGAGVAEVATFRIFALLEKTSDVALTTKRPSVTVCDTPRGDLYIYQNYQHIYTKRCGFGSYARIHYLKYFFVKIKKVVR